jgi:hypothetical protein
MMRLFCFRGFDERARTNNEGEEEQILFLEIKKDM